MNKNYISFMKHLKSEREKNGQYSQIELAEKLGLTQGFLNKVENGKAGLSIDKLFDYLEINNFDITPMFRVKIKGGDGIILEEAKKNIIKKIKTIDDDSFWYLFDLLEILDQYNKDK